MYELAINNDPPLRITLGSDGFTKITEKVEKYKENLKNYEKISKRTNIEE